MPEKFAACRAADVKPGAPIIVTVKNRSVGIFNVDGSYYALLNVCPHRGAALCEGIQCGTTLPTDEYEFVYGRENEVVRCAWHGWEFDIRTGQCLGSPRTRARTYPTTVENGEVMVHL